MTVDGFYEWKHVGAGKNVKKYPYFFHLKETEIFAFAAIWEHYEEYAATCCFITTEPNELMRPIHDRLPVIITPKDYDAWFDWDAEPRELQRLVPQPANNTSSGSVTL